MFTKLVNTIPPNPQRQSNPEHTIYGVCSRRRTMEGPTDHYAATPVVLPAFATPRSSSMWFRDTENRTAEGHGPTRLHLLAWPAHGSWRL